VGKVTNYFSKISVAEVFVEAQNLRTGDDILITGETTGAYEDVLSEMRVDLKPVDEVKKGSYFSFQTKELVRRNDKVFKIVKAEDLKK